MPTLKVVHPVNIDKEMLIDKSSYDPEKHVLWEDRHKAETVEIEIEPAKPAVVVKILKNFYDPKTMKLVSKQGVATDVKTRARKATKLD